MLREILALFTPNTAYIVAPHLRPQLEALARRGLVARYGEMEDAWEITRRGELVRDFQQ